METTAIIIRKVTNGYLLTAVSGQEESTESVYLNITDALKAGKGLLTLLPPLPPPPPPPTAEDDDL